MGVSTETVSGVSSNGVLIQASISVQQSDRGGSLHPLQSIPPTGVLVCPSSFHTATSQQWPYGHCQEGNETEFREL